MKIISDWREQNLQCYFCGETRSVKYKRLIKDPQNPKRSLEVPTCNKCMFKAINTE